MSDYEKKRQANIRRNQEIFHQLGLGALPGGRDKGKAAADTAPASEQSTTPDGELYTERQMENPSSDSEKLESDSEPQRDEEMKFDDKLCAAAVEFLEGDLEIVAPFESSQPDTEERGHFR